MFIIDKELISIILLICLLTLSTVVTGSKEIIYQYIGCWPRYGETIIESGKYASLIFYFILSYYCATYLRWLKKNDSNIRKFIGYCAGLSIGGIITIIIFVSVTSIIFMIYPIFHMGYIVC